MWSWAILLLALLHLSLNFANEIQLGPCELPAEFPQGLALSIQPYENFGRVFKIPFAYVVTARNSEEVLRITNWAYKAKYRVRAMGSKHTWSPLTFSKEDAGVPCPKTILIDTTKHLNSMIMNPPDETNPSLSSVTVGPGVSLLNLLQFLESNNLGVIASPTVGSITVGGMIAIGAHGTGIPHSKLDDKNPGHTYGSWSNMIIELELVAWDPHSNSYKLKTLNRSQKETKAFLTSLGRTFITQVTLRVGKDQNLRTQSHFYLSAQELFTHPDQVTKSTRTVENFVSVYGRTMFLIIMPRAQAFTWVLTINTEKIRPQTSLQVYKPFNYIFQNMFPSFADPMLKNLLRLRSNLWKRIGPALYHYLAVGTKAARANDYWGPSKNHLLFVPQSVPRMLASSFTVLTSQFNLQLVAHILRRNFVQISKELERETQGEFYMAGEFNIRVSGVDDPADVEIPGAEAPSFSNASPMPEYPDYQLVVWCEISSYEDNPHMTLFLSKLQDAYYKEIHHKWGIMRVEWPKAFATTHYGGYWSNSTVMKHFARTFSTSDKLEEWNWAVNTLNAFDPHKVFSNKFLNELLVPQ